METCDHDFLSQKIFDIRKYNESHEECTSFSNSSSSRGNDRTEVSDRSKDEDKSYDRNGRGDREEEGNDYCRGTWTRTGTRTGSRLISRPPSLCLLEDVIMPSVGGCCAQRGVSTGRNRAFKDSQNLLAAIDEGIAFLRDKYPSVA